MNKTWLAVAQVSLTPPLVRDLEGAALAIGRLDARISASFCKERWHEEATMAGFATSLRAHDSSAAESDLFSHLRGTPLPHRLPATLKQEDCAVFEEWRSALQVRAAPPWRELVHVAVDLPEAWDAAPALLRLLALAAHHTQQQPSTAPPIMPRLLQALGLSEAVLPSLVIIDPAWRHRPRKVAASVRRSLRRLTRAALRARKRLARIEAGATHAARVLDGEPRAGALRPLIDLVGRHGIVTPRGIAREYGLSISGAGKLLARAARLGLVVEVSGRASWRTYLSPHLAIEFGYVEAPRGRPPALAPRPLPLTPTLQAFDDELAAIDAMLARFGPLPNGGSDEEE
ncbi:hypothetical protein PK98_14540 [Croceibacterium mercuriale]|uniref:Uncharacterized protein n=1 Tax=Croceibacterium mercuriale TaxID=1572751 RepID=A0A0B2BWM7_9SPHN|nr:hypothetical protein [Croceibacterium mercuriale]KHL24210.1 hypothetical protein PK98_14540 [Croceibacterium mercuriale]